MVLLLTCSRQLASVRELSLTGNCQGYFVQGIYVCGMQCLGKNSVLFSTISLQKPNVSVIYNKASLVALTQTKMNNILIYSQSADWQEGGLKTERIVTSKLINMLIF